MVVVPAVAAEPIAVEEILAELASHAAMLVGDQPCPFLNWPPRPRVQVHQVDFGPSATSGKGGGARRMEHHALIDLVLLNRVQALMNHEDIKTRRREIESPMNPLPVLRAFVCSWLNQRGEDSRTK